MTDKTNGDKRGPWPGDMTIIDIDDDCPILKEKAFLDTFSMLVEAAMLGDANVVRSPDMVGIAGVIKEEGGSTSVHIPKRKFRARLYLIVDFADIESH